MEEHPGGTGSTPESHPEQLQYACSTARQYHELLLGMHPVNAGHDPIKGETQWTGKLPGGLK